MICPQFTTKLPGQRTLLFRAYGTFGLFPARTSSTRRAVCRGEPELAWSAADTWRDDRGRAAQQVPAHAAEPVLSRGSVSARNQQRQGLSTGKDNQERVPSASSNGDSDLRTDGNAPSSRPAPGIEQKTQSRSASSWRLATGTDVVLTFAYGANMNFLTLARREVRVLSRDPAVVADPNVRLVFKHQGGYATLERTDEAAAAEGAGTVEPRFRPYDGQVHGVLYRLSRADFDKLVKREGGYVVQEIPVRTYDGALHSALAFVSNPLFKLPQEVLPTEKYLAAVREGARDNYLDPGYQAFLSGISTVPSAGLGPDYFNTPSKYMGYCFLLVVALITMAYFFQH